jgi:hypothetical protein
MREGGWGCEGRTLRIQPIMHFAVLAVADISDLPTVALILGPAWRGGPAPAVRCCRRPSSGLTGRRLPAGARRA